MGASNSAKWNDNDEMLLSGNLSYLQLFNYNGGNDHRVGEIRKGYEFSFYNHEQSNWLETGRGQGMSAEKFMELLINDDPYTLFWTLVSDHNLIHDNFGDERIYSGSGNDIIKLERFGYRFCGFGR